MELQGFSRDLQLAAEAASRAGDVIRESYQSSVNATRKGVDKGLVTETDQNAEKAIVEILKSGSDHGVIGEEGGSHPGSTGSYWVIDPIDGTTNFVRGLPMFASAIALMRGREFVLGVVYDPNIDELFYAENGRGSWINGTQVSVSDITDSAWAMINIEHGRSERDRQLHAEVVNRLCYDYSLRRLGTSVVEMCYMVKGNTDAFICSGNEIWDFAAPSVLITEAGGVFTDWKGNPWDGSHSFTLLSNRTLHRELVEKIGNFQPDDASVESFMEQYLP